MAGVFLLLRSTRPELVPYWLSEEALRAELGGPGEKLPDAMIRKDGERRVIEFGGAYRKDKLISFHDYCEAECLPYELW